MIDIYEDESAFLVPDAVPRGPQRLVRPQRGRPECSCQFTQGALVGALVAKVVGSWLLTHAHAWYSEKVPQPGLGPGRPVTAATRVGTAHVYQFRHRGTTDSLGAWAGADAKPAAPRPGFVRAA